MKLANLLFVLLLIFISVPSFSQELSDFKKEMKELTQATNLDGEQLLKLNEIYAKRVSDLKSIETLRSTDEQAFINKRRSIYMGSENSIHLLMNPDQIESYTLYKRALRIERADKIKKLKKKNASKDDIIDASYGILN